MADEYVLSGGRVITDTELARKMKIIAAAQPELTPELSTGYSWDEAGMADLFGECYKEHTRYCTQAKSWYTYSNGAWRHDDGELLVAEKIKEFSRLMVLYCGEIGDIDKRSAYLRFISKMGDRRFRDRMAKDARSVMAIDYAAFDANPYLVNCLNGTYDLSTGAFRKHDPKDFLTMQSRVTYSESPKPCARWEAFIKEITCGDGDKALYLQRALGYSLQGSANEECMFILHGKTTRNGKSTLLGAINYLLGDYACVSPVAVICKSDRSKNADSASPTIAALKGKRFVTMAESDQYGKLDVEAIKQYTGGEEISARRLYQEQFTFLPQFTLWLSCNDLPAVNDKSLFASDRVRVIEFNKHFTEAERDETLKDQFKTPEAMAGIFRWLVSGYTAYTIFGLKMSEPMKKVVHRYERDNDLVLLFLEEECDHASETESVRLSELYAHYKIWAKTNGYFIMSAKKFYSGVESHADWVTERKYKDGYPVYKGIIIK